MHTSTTDAIDYVTFGQIQQQKALHFQETGQGLSFYDTIQQLIQAQALQHGVPSIPDFLSWNLLHYDALRDLIYQIPVPLGDVIPVRRQKNANVTKLSTHNLVQINQESCYSDGTQVSIDYFAVVWCMEGNCRLNIGKNERHMKKGDLFLIPPYLPYCVWNTPEDLVITIISDSPHFANNFHSLIHQNNPLSTFFRKSLFEEQSEPLYFQLRDTKDTRSLIQHLFAEFLKRDSLSEIMFNNYLQILYVNIIRSLEQLTLLPEDNRRITVSDLMPAILQYITQHYHTLTLDELSEAFHYETAYLSKQIHKSTGKRFSDIITELKLKQAGELLLTTKDSIERISELCGYNSADHFSYMFRKTFGQSPQSYRKKHTT